MKPLRLLMASSVLCICATTACQHSRADLLVGEWKSTTPTVPLGIPLGTEMTFGREGSMTIVSFDDVGKPDEKVDAIYKVQDNKINFTLKLPDGDQPKPLMTIQQITKEKLTLQLGDEYFVEFTRVK